MLARSAVAAAEVVGAKVENLEGWGGKAGAELAAVVMVEGAEEEERLAARLAAGMADPDVMEAAASKVAAVSSRREEREARGAA